MRELAQQALPDQKWLRFSRSEKGPCYISAASRDVCKSEVAFDITLRNVPSTRGLCSLEPARRHDIANETIDFNRLDRKHCRNLMIGNVVLGG
jgi:hypothetical protein